MVVLCARFGISLHDDPQERNFDMSWQKEIDELRARQKLAQQMGGPEKVKRQHDNKRLTVRERIDQMLDPGSFHEIGSIAGKAAYNEAGEVSEFLPGNFVMGRGRIDSRPVVVGGDDFTVRGGAGDAAIGSKQVYAEQMANELQLPIVRLIDGTGGGGSVKTLEVDQRTYVPYMQGWKYVVDNLASVPVVGLGLGPVAGLGSARLVTSHYSVMVKENSQMFIAGPPLVARAGQIITKEELGGAEMHAKAGAVDDVVDSEQEAFARTRRFLSYLPSSVHQLPPRAPCTDPVDRRDEWLIEAIPRDKRKVYDIRRIIKSVVDKDSFFEMGRKYGGSVVTGFARPRRRVSGRGAVVRHHAAPCLRRRRRRALQLYSFAIPLCLAVRKLGFAADRGRSRSRLPRRACGLRQP